MCCQKPIHKLILSRFTLVTYCLRKCLHDPAFAGKILEQMYNVQGGTPVADPGENLTGALHSNFGHCGCGGRG